MRNVKSRDTTIAVGALALLALSGCSSLPEARDAPSSYRESLDSEVMAVVESAAVRSGTEVYWVNPPRKTRKD